MPKASSVDWDKAKLLRYQGFTFKAIATKLGCTRGCIQSRSFRENWNIKNAEVRQTTLSTLERGDRVSLQERAKKFVANMADDVDESLTLARSLTKPADYQELVTRETALEKLNKRGRATYGLDQAGPSTVVNIAVLGGDVNSNRALESPAIDAEIVDSPVNNPAIPGSKT